MYNISCMHYFRTRIKSKDFKQNIKMLYVFFYTKKLKCKKRNRKKIKKIELVQINLKNCFFYINRTKNVFV